ncbi:cyclin-like protein [Phascolomyces articulosus]|uniref:Cyclin-like protein n=1 Tax=Phascolomyces articulosus TaxID=60185 RepID=A0AAD5JXJ2_9FUNG|nr:cyclin-like protein [Phascolomyces articulosus]
MAEDSSTTTLPPIYEESSQYRHWRFSPSQLWDTRNTSHEAAVERVRRNFQEDQEESKSTEANELKYLSIEDTLTLCRYYEETLQSICGHLKFPEVVMATAVIYMKRFFLYNTVMDYHPRDIALTCLFLATKSESERIPIEQFGKNLRIQSTDQILALEFVVSQGLKFEYLIHHPYRPAYGFFLDMQKIDAMDVPLLKETYTKAQQVISSMFLTDLCLIYQSSQLALAAFMVAGKNNQFDAQVVSFLFLQQYVRYIEKRFGNEQKEQLLKLIDQIKETLDQLQAVSRDKATAIDKQLRLCMNPAKDPNSAL